MALIKCPECKKKISDQCNSCPNCGYPIGNYVEERNSETNSEVVNSLVDNKTPIYKKIWFWAIIVVVVMAVIAAIILLINRDTKPRYDEKGNPVFVEFTSEVYTNADDYLGYYINIKGKVFQVIGDNGSATGIQIWVDPDTCEQNLMIYYNTDAEVKQGDYIICSGYIDSVTKYKNAYGAELQVPLVYSFDLQKATYIDVMAPKIDKITPENLKQEQLGYSITIDKVEFAELETRVYVTIINNGNASLNLGDAVIVQDGKQYNSKENYEADYEQLPYEIVKGVSCSGIIVFSPLDANDFELSFDLHSDDFDEELDKFAFTISKKGSFVQETEKETEDETEIEGVTEDETQEESQTYKEDDSDNDKPSAKPEPVDRSQEAISEAINVANKFFPTDRYFVKNVLLNPSLEEGFEAFSYEEATYAIENSNINWGMHAATKLSAYSNDYGFWISPNDMVDNWLDNYESFTDDEIEYAINNCGVNWNDIALLETKSYIEEYKNRDEHITAYDIIEKLSIGGFSDENITYAIDNTDGYDKGVAEEPEERAMRLFGYGYSREEIIDDFMRGGWSREEAENLVNNCGIQ